MRTCGNRDSSGILVGCLNNDNFRFFSKLLKLRVRAGASTARGSAFDEFLHGWRGNHQQLRLRLFDLFDDRKLLTPETVKAKDLAQHSERCAFFATRIVLRRRHSMASRGCAAKISDGIGRRTSACDSRRDDRSLANVISSNHLRVGHAPLRYPTPGPAAHPPSDSCNSVGSAKLRHRHHNGSSGRAR